MKANWRYTNIQHGPRIALGLSVIEYCVLDMLYQSQTHPSISKNGWTDTGCHTIAKFLDLSSGTVKGIFDRVEKAGFMERFGISLKRTTPLFYNVAYIKSDEELRTVQFLHVQKMNYERSETELRNVQKLNYERSETELRNVQKLNYERSETEHINKEIKGLNKLKEKDGEKISPVFSEVDEDLKIEIFDQIGEVDEETKMIISLPDFEKEKSCAKKEKAQNPWAEKALEIAKVVIPYLNEKLGRSGASAFRAETKAYLSEITGRLRQDKWELDDFKLVIDFKVAEWKGNPRMEGNLVPTTLFRACHAANYLPNARAWDERGRPGFNVTAAAAKQTPLYRNEQTKKPFVASF
jgi:uncharacterized phage protein (TIGR02220 family)